MNDRARRRGRVGLPARMAFWGACVAWAGPEPADVRSLAEANTAFAFDLYRKLAAGQGDLALSPLSISTALAMTYAGAAGETESQMARVLHFRLPRPSLHAAFEVLQPPGGQASAASSDGLSVANALWRQRGMSLLADFREAIEKHYGAVLREADFAREPDRAREQINAWVAERTREKIVDLVPPGAFDALTRLVLANAVYFKQRWQFQFRPADTSPGEFTRLDGSRVKVPMMRQTTGFRYAENGDLQLLEMPYAGGGWTMLLLLPKDPQGLASLEKSLSATALGKWVSSLRGQKVSVLLPRFRAASGFSLAETLASLGMTDAFLPDRADFSGMTGRTGLFVSAALHKALVEVTEEGTQAAAASAVVVGLTSAAPVPVFQADRPFLFLIRDSKWGSILFLGRVANPRP